ncbi:hypothetical protein AKJ41_04865 [candidate division MSBL1 archaeon SCGC-AAA259O05]|uniref:DUF5678 domain-containing protein n=1 Tax=candidate division MSBL1 archaeon SCGC-AAA259O05 TaxID=1698271 RepID=A0A133V037_9EURY|nr:hypothetical protein AKJ41_04865 [candidate division MSBL1 archaeon SCGC-AAA259O05]
MIDATNLGEQTGYPSVITSTLTPGMQEQEIPPSIWEGLEAHSTSYPTSLIERAEEFVRWRNRLIKQKLDWEERNFQKIMDDLPEKYQNKYVAVSNGVVIDSADDDLKLAKKVRKRSEPVYIGYVGKEKIATDYMTPFPRR